MSSSDIVGCVLPRREMTTVKSGWAPAGVKAALSGSTSHVCSAGWMRSRKETAEEQSAVHSVALNTTSSSPRWVRETLLFCGKYIFSSTLLKYKSKTRSDWCFRWLEWFLVLLRPVGVFPAAGRQSSVTGQSLCCCRGGGWDCLLVSCHIWSCDCHAGPQS